MAVKCFAVSHGYIAIVDAMHLPDYLRTFFEDKQGKVAIIQAPNLPILGWFACLVAAKFIHASPWHTGLSQLSAAFLFLWAYLEITSGLSPFRRVLGAIVMAWTIFGFFR